MNYSKKQAISTANKCGKYKKIKNLAKGLNIESLTLLKGIADMVDI